LKPVIAKIPVIARAPKGSKQPKAVAKKIALKPAKASGCRAYGSSLSGNDGLVGFLWRALCMVVGLGGINREISREIGN
jgi:hypothetical protein